MSKDKVLFKTQKFLNLSPSQSVTYIAAMVDSWVSGISKNENVDLELEFGGYDGSIRITDTEDGNTPTRAVDVLLGSLEKFRDSMPKFENVNLKKKHPKPTQSRIWLYKDKDSTEFLTWEISIAPWEDSGQCWADFRLGARDRNVELDFGFKNTKTGIQKAQKRVDSLIDIIQKAKGIFVKADAEAKAKNAKKAKPERKVITYEVKD